MTRTRRRRSLFWTIAGLFLVVTVLGALAQWVVATAVLRPLEEREARSHAELRATDVAAEIARLADPSAIDSLFARRRAELMGRGFAVVYRAVDGSVYAVPPGAGRHLERRHLEGRVPPPRTPGGGPPGPGRPPRMRRWEILAQRPVVRDGVAIGELTIVRPAHTPGLPDAPGWRAPILVLPVALVASALAGLILVRLLMRRLRALEAVTARVAAGDLSARTNDASGDEIGRLAEQLDHMTDRLAAARAELERSEQQRRELFADITHELATPLTSIRGYGETLLDPNVPVSDVERDRYLRGVVEEARRLERFARDLFDLARLEAGAAPLERERLDWAALCRNTVERFEPRFRAAGLALRWRGPDTEVWVRADGHRLVQALENLLANALRYVSTGGSVEVQLGPAAGGPAGAARARLEVRDDGPGVSPEALPHLFERFYRGVASGMDEGRAGEPRRADSAGLGLAIAREIAARHGGSVGAAAAPPRGLVVWIEIGLDPPPNPAMPPAPPRSS
jgi:signal transduction histidine kinase